LAGVTTPTLYEWLGGMPALLKLAETFYARVPDDPILAPVFAGMSAEHPRHVAEFLAEVFGGPSVYSEQRGGHAEMIRHHLSRSLTQVQRRRWMELLLACGDEVGLPDDPEFRSAFVAYLEWGTRLAVINSQPDADATLAAPMPKWGWGEARGPYVAGGSTPEE
jgi:hemoglobin